MITTYEDAIRQATKLLRLANSDNPNEAAVAAAKAQEIMDRYSIKSLETQSYDEEPEEEIQDFTRESLNRDKNRVPWKGRLAMVLAKQNACGVYRVSGTGRLNLIGRSRDVATVRYLYGYLEREIMRITRRETKGYSAVYKNNFRLGVIETIKEKLDEQAAATREALRAEATADAPDSRFALVSVNKAIEKRKLQAVAVDQYMNRNGFGSGRRSSARYDYSAREHGREAGQEIQINAARGALSGKGRLTRTGRLSG